jgi:hypothetical protein
MTKTGRGVASPRPPCVGVQGEALPLPAGGARERQRGQHVVLSLPEAARLARSANPTSIQCQPYPIQGGRTSIGERTRRSRAPTRGRVKGGGRGPGCWQANGRDAVAPLPAVS